MRWILICGTAFALPLDAMSMKVSGPEEMRLAIETPEPAEEVPFDADLFRKDVQVFSGHLEFLYWTVDEGALDYALKMRHSAWGPSPSYAQGRMESGTFGWDPGFRASFSFFRATRYWEVRWSYTRLTVRGNDCENKPSNPTKFITGTWPQITTGALASAKSHLHMNYNVVDMNVDRYFVPNPHLRMRVLGGFIVAWIDQDWKVRYTDSSLHNSIIRNRWSFTGAGLKSGMTFDWFWTNDIYVSAVGTTAVLIGSYSNTSEQRTNFQPTPADNTAVPIRDMDFRDTRPAFTMQMMLGPSWQKNFCNARYEVFVGYEINLWANLNQIYHSTSGGPSEAKETWINSSLTGLQGLTTRFTMDF